MLKEIDGFPSLPDGCQSDWLKCALKAIGRVQEAIEWTGFFWVRECWIPFQILPADVCERSPLVFEQRTVNYKTIPDWNHDITFTCTHSISLFAFTWFLFAYIFFFLVSRDAIWAMCVSDRNWLVTGR